MTDHLTPYDTGARCEPKIWPAPTRLAVENFTGTAVSQELDRFGRVDFENDESATIVTVYVERTKSGHRLVIEPHCDPEELEVVRSDMP